MKQSIWKLLLTAVVLLGGASAVLAAPAANSAESKKDVVDVAVASKDHKTLVTAVTAADLVGVLKNQGPFTVFAPTDEAFSKLPAGTVEGLLKPEKKETLQDILQYHVSLGVFNDKLLTDGEIIGQANGDNVTVSNKNGKISINGANIVGTVVATNGIVHVIDKVLLPPEKK